MFKSIRTHGVVLCLLIGGCANQQQNLEQKAIDGTTTDKVVYYIHVIDTSDDPSKVKEAKTLLEDTLLFEKRVSDELTLKAMMKLGGEWYRLAAQEYDNSLAAYKYVDTNADYARKNPDFARAYLHLAVQSSTMPYWVDAKVRYARLLIDGAGGDVKLEEAKQQLIEAASYYPLSPTIIHKGISKGRTRSAKNIEQSLEAQRILRDQFPPEKEYEKEIIASIEASQRTYSVLDLTLTFKGNTEPVIIKDIAVNDNNCRYSVYTERNEVLWKPFQRGEEASIFLACSNVYKVEVDTLNYGMVTYNF